MRRVAKGKLAGKKIETPSSLGLSSFGPADSEALAQAAMSALSDAALYIGEDGIVIACSESLVEKSGLSASEIVGAHIKELGVSPEEGLRLAIALRAARDENGGLVSVKLKSKKSRALPANMKMTIVDAGGAKNCLAAMSLWIDGEKAETERVLAMESSEFDSATGMLGRLAFMKAASLAYHRDGFKDRPAVICMDLVRFGELNERLGHDKCDEILEQLAERIKGQLRRGDWAGRMGSDEFCLYASFAGNPNDARSVAERLIDAVSQPFAVGEGALEQVSATLGVAMGPKDGATIQALVSSAERALKLARAQGLAWEFATK